MKTKNWKLKEISKCISLMTMALALTVCTIATSSYMSFYTSKRAYGPETDLGTILSTQFEEVDINGKKEYIGKGGIPAVHKDYYSYGIYNSFYMRELGADYMSMSFSSYEERIKPFIEDVNNTIDFTGCDTQLKKAIKIHDKVCSIITYDECQANLCGDTSHRHGYCPLALDEAIKTGTGICVTYSGIFYYLCQLNGISCGLMGNHNHTWNRIMADGNSYFVDCTADDNYMYSEEPDATFYRDYFYRVY